jgi:hypothetical protein
MFAIRGGLDMSRAAVGRVRMVGFEADAGTTPMRLRRDTRKLTSAHDFAFDGGVEMDTPSIDPS